MKKNNSKKQTKPRKQSDQLSSFSFSNLFIHKTSNSKSFLLTKKQLKAKEFVFLKKHLHFITAIFSLIALTISYNFWKVETQWVMKWMIIYTAFALFYWSIKPAIRWFREKWNK